MTTSAMLEDKDPGCEVTLSIVSHNSKRDLQGLMPGISKACGNLKYEIIVVDNDSADGSAGYVASRYPEALLIKNSERKGYGANHNQAIRVARGEYTALMNADLVLSPGSMEKLKAFMDDNPGIGMVSGNFVYPDGSPQYLNKRLPSLADLFIRRFVPSSIRSRKNIAQRMDRYEMKDIGYSDFTEVPFLSGAFLFARTEALKSVGGFDERFFLYFEDVDLCRSMAKRWKTVFHPGVHIVHRWHRAAHNEARWAMVFIASAFKYFCKWGLKFF